MEDLFLKNFQTCCIHSCNRLASRQGKKDPDYNSKLQKCNDLYYEIQEKLKDSHDLIDEFDVVKNEVAAFHEELIYQQGFQDCVTLLRWMGAF